MTTVLTAVDSTYHSNDATGLKRIFFSGSSTNPYSAGGESIDISAYFKTKLLGGKVTMVNPSVTVDLTGIAASGTVRATTASTTTLLLQFLNTGLPVTTAVGRWVDNTVANISTMSFYAELIGY
jgi:hypothetical protein